MSLHKVCIDMMLPSLCQLSLHELELFPRRDVIRIHGYRARSFHCRSLAAHP